MSCTLKDLAWLVVLHPLKLDWLPIFDVHSGQRRLKHGEQLIHSVSVVEVWEDVEVMRLLHVDVAVGRHEVGKCPVAGWPPTPPPESCGRSKGAAADLPALYAHPNNITN